MSFEERALTIGDCAYRQADGRVDGGYVPLLGEQYYRIQNYDRMAPFFMSIVSSSDHWLFISSTGGLTCGRRNADSALFPYDTDDKIAASSGVTGHKAVLLVTKDRRTYLWEPFSERYAGLYRVERNLYKNVTGDKLVFEETNRDLDVETSGHVFRAMGTLGGSLSTSGLAEPGIAAPARDGGRPSLQPLGCSTQSRQASSHGLVGRKSGTGRQAAPLARRDCGDT